MPFSSLTVAYWLLASGHEDRLQRPVMLYSLRQNFCDLVLMRAIKNVCQQEEKSRLMFNTLLTEFWRSRTSYWWSTIRSVTDSKRGGQRVNLRQRMRKMTYVVVFHRAWDTAVVGFFSTKRNAENKSQIARAHYPTRVRNSSTECSKTPLGGLTLIRTARFR